MSSSDYTNLRRLRHVYYPSLSNHTHQPPIHQPYIHQPHTHQQDPYVNIPYVSQPSYHSHHHSDNIDLSHNCDIHHSHTYNNHQCNTNQCNCNSCNRHNYNSRESGCNQSGVNSTPTSIVTYPPQPAQPAQCAPAAPIIIQSPAQQPQYPYYDYPHPPAHSHINEPYDVCNYTHVDKSSVNITKREYYLLPTFYGTVTVSVNACQDFRKNMQVLCVSDLSSNNYFEGTVYDYDKPSGEITIHQIKNITGNFSKPSRYIISIYSASHEMDSMKGQIEALYKQVFGIDISGPEPPTNIGGQTVNVDTEDTAIKNLYTYFFNETIANEATYAKTSVYLTTKINYLYTYFFNKNLITETTFNPNNNNIVLDSLTNKVEQLNLYFFADKAITSLTL
jgi:hypothetical protein